MTISNIKELSKLIDLCRKKGIDSVEIDGIKLKLGTLERTTSADKAGSPEIMSVADYTPEDILNWSSTPYDGVG